MTTRSTILLAAALLMTAACSNRSPKSDAQPSREPEARAVTPPPAPVASAAPSPASPTATPLAATPEKHAEATRPTATKLAVKRLVLARDVAGREPVGASDWFVSGAQDRIYAFVELDNPERALGEITISFESPTAPARGAVPVSVGAQSRWRTWAFTRTARPIGDYTAVVRNARGEVLAKRAFTVTADPYASSPST